MEKQNHYKMKCHHCKGKGYINKPFYQWQKSSTTKKCNNCKSTDGLQLIEEWNSMTGRVESTPYCETCYHKRF